MERLPERRLDDHAQVRRSLCWTEGGQKVARLNTSQRQLTLPRVFR